MDESEERKGRAILSIEEAMKSFSEVSSLLEEEFGYSSRCAKLKANDLIQEEHGIDVSARVGIDFSQSCSREELASEAEKLSQSPHGEAISQFWAVFDELEQARPHTVDHSNDPQIIAVNLKHFLSVCESKGIDMPGAKELREALKHSKERPFRDARSVSSAVPRHPSRVIYCLTFYRQ